MTKIIIVDEGDNVIGTKEREEVKEEIYRVSALWIKNSKNEFLLARRSLNKTNHPGKWGPAVAGTVEEGESYEENIYKEAEEELGIKDLKFEKGPKRFTINIWKHFTQWYLLVMDQEKFDFNKEEVEEIKWYSNEEFLKELEENPDKFVAPMKERFELFQIH